jgi:phage terminase large subunit-like protein
VIVKESISGNVGEPIVLRDWQKELLNNLFALDSDGKRIHRSALVGIARKNGKSALMASIALYEFILGPEGGEVLIVARDREQAKIIFNTCLQMLERSKDLRGKFHKNRDTLTNTDTGTTLKALSRDALSAEGSSPSCAIVDELHAATDDSLWNVLKQGQGARREPILIAITTAGGKADRFGNDSIAFKLYNYGKQVTAGEVDDPSFFFAWWEPTEGDFADHTDVDVWFQANPGLGDLVSVESLTTSLPSTPVPEFRTKQLNQWVSSMSAALPQGKWESLKSDRTIVDGEQVVLGFDGAVTQDSTALVVCTLDGHLDVVGLWERPLNNEDPDWIIDADEVLDAIRSACARWDVVELAYDPAYWRHEMAKLVAEGVNAVEYPHTSARSVPAWDSFYSGVMAGDVSHSGHAGLCRHVDNLVLKTTSFGTYPTKESKNSKRKIDAAMASIFSYDRARWNAANVYAPRTWLLV